MKTILEEMAELLAEVRSESPLVHSITNYVTVNDVANATLAVGASPVMADDVGEAGEIAAGAAALVLNIGTLNQRTIGSMLTAGARANALGIPVIFDPVGAGVSVLRSDATAAILTKVKIAVIRGNRSEIAFIAGLPACGKGVDVSPADAAKSGEEAAGMAARRCGCVAAMTGAVDVITDGERVIRVGNGHPLLARVTGTGCMTTALVGAFAGAAAHRQPQGIADYLTAAAAGVAAMGIAGEIAYERAGELGTGSFRIALMDALSRLSAADLTARGKLEEEGGAAGGPKRRGSGEQELKRREPETRETAGHGPEGPPCEREARRERSAGQDE